MEMKNQIDFGSFPTTRYQGSKRKILSFIYDIANELVFETVLDAFGGTAVVSYLFKKMNKSVTYNDNLKFNSIIGKVLIENKQVTLSTDDVAKLLEKNRQFDYYSFVSNHFKDIYYLDDENEWIDLVVSNIIQTNHYVEPILEFKKALAYYALFQACLVKRPFNLFHRRNLYLRTNDVKRSFGNKTTWDRPFKEHFHKFIMEANQLVFDNGKICKSLNSSVFDIEENEFDLVYFDPPYYRKSGYNETADYLACYHFLEGLSDYQRWHEFLYYDSVNLRFKSTTAVQSKQKNTKEYFEELIYKFRKSKIILSYKYGGNPSISYLVKLIKKVKGNVYTKSKHYKYALNKKNTQTQKNKEVLIIGT